MKMTVKEAFDKYNYIVIYYVFECKCSECGKFFDEVDEEYSFEGNLEDYKEWLTHYPVIDLDDDIEQIEGKDNEFNLYRVAAAEELCPCCRESDE